MPVKYTVRYIALIAIIEHPEETFWIEKDKVEIKCKTEINHRVLEKMTRTLLQSKYIYGTCDVREFELTGIDINTC